MERRVLQIAIAIASFVPIGAGGWGVIGGFDQGAALHDNHVRYLSGLLLGIGLVYVWTIPTIERRGAVVRALATIIVVGGLARLADAFHAGFAPGVVLPLVMELGVTPALALWRERVERVYA
ncbi:DUF4345 family protein [Phenylobacterium immobile]|uniref:DUF4345 family protein n=1 Tax=Phenylobacterium immobile TaxID=21 RepID=UPI000B130ABF|nr:DUF4345 family protein [Phenylobacterium immobile]